MGHSGAPFRTLVLLVALTALAGCKLLEEEPESTGDDGAGSAKDAPPSIWGEPKTATIAGTPYLFFPESEDPNGDVLIFDIANEPQWARFDESSGELHGLPGDEDIGTTEGIVISVTDGSSVVALPSFAITVDPPGGSGGGGGGDDGGSSSPPGISGQPNGSVVVDTLYSFQPDVSDPDGDTLAFSIVNKPAWANFSTVTGRLQGTPDSGDIGTTENIRLSVSDGTAIDSLNPFSISVVAAAPASFTVSWTPPTRNADGSPLTNLAGYKIYYGTVSGEYNEIIDVNSAGMTSYSIDGIAPGTYFLVMTSVNSDDVESVYSGELSFELGQ